ncbi:CRTAC1 family protein [Draconibacterium halophilum]|uniref:CRTAC1 family protein n=1 Tax=Draconibacterium halophilum TaxID=2706887 RepID=A0A6C0RC62_9BACT|nr:CRTAC1 family protein [Draconibacterium halophilum]QIA07699.1 CRTAC1 family protein [Draconibacterium halophilum]
MTYLKINRSFVSNKLLTLSVSILLFVTACQSNKNTESKQLLTPPSANDAFYQEIADEIGLDFVHSIGDDELSNIVESSGVGAAFIDFDQDGFIDIYACNGTWRENLSSGDKPKNPSHNHLYKNMGNGTFRDVTEQAKVGGPWYGMGITVGDYDNDGFPDIFLSNFGENVLLHNNGDGTFTDESESAGVKGGGKFSVGASWLDFDNDGFLDLYVGNYLFFDPEYDYYYAPDGFPGPLAYDSQPDILYRNNGDGTFEDVTQAMGIEDLDGRAMGVGIADYNADGFVDIYVANDHTVNYLWQNNQGKGFTDVGTMSGTGFSQSGEATVSMSVDFADFNGDGLLDIFISDDTYCSLYKNLGGNVFSDISYSAGISVASGQFVGWSSSFLDFDNDGDVDIFKSNGELKHLYGHEDQLFENIGNDKFEDISVDLSSYFQEENVGRGACTGDYDNDGDLDIFIMNIDGACKFIRNNKGNQNNWIEFSLQGTKSNRDGIGALVSITCGETKQVAQKKSTTGYLSQGDPRMHFGVGKSETIDLVEVKWPSGIVQKIANIQTNQILPIIEPE